MLAPSNLSQLALADHAAPGALVLAHSLRDAGTTKQLACLVTLDSVSAEVITQIKVRLASQHRPFCLPGFVLTVSLACRPSTTMLSQSREYKTADPPTCI